MRALLIDTSTRGRVLSATATREGDEWRMESLDASAGDLDSGLPARIAAALDGGRALDAVVVTLGPGSYTGVRAGIAAAAGLSAALGVPLHGLGSAELLACAAPSGGTAVWAGIDAGRGGLYATRVALDARTGQPAECNDAVRVDAATWQPPAAEPLVVLDSIDRVALERAVRASFALALDRPPLDLTATEPITVSHSTGPRV